MTCPKCQSQTLRIANPRHTVDGKEVIRRRICRACGHRWTTRELDATRLQSKPPLRYKQKPSA